MGIFEIIIEASIGFAGFAGVVIALSGDSRNWLQEEKLRMGLMLILFLTPLFMSFLALVLLQDLPEYTVGRLLSLVSGTYFICSCTAFFFMARKIYSIPGTTYSVRVAVFCQVSLILMALATLLNGLLNFAPLLTLFSALLVWSLFMGSIIFLRILFLRPGSISKK